jgi:predicted alpha/beta hydrolase
VVSPRDRFMGQRSLTERKPFGAQIKFAALDGYELGGVHFESAHEFEPTLAVIIAGGGGIPARHYRHFATFLASSGIPVLTFDYRGVGMSRPKRLRGFNASAEDWSEWDCGGAIAWIHRQYPRAKLAAVAHSIGSLIIGGAKNVGECSRLVFIAAHTGYYGDYSKNYRIPMALLWHVVMPFLTRLFGYFPARRLGLGEDIPAGMAMQWAARRTPDLRPEATAPDASRAREMLARFCDIKMPVFALSFSDDAFATDMGSRRLLAVYPGLVARYECVKPAQVGLANIGHFGFFRRDAKATLWPIVLFYLLSESTESSISPKAVG